MSRITSSIDDKIVVKPHLGMRKEPCVICEMPVFLAEKLVISRKTYHRTCFRCARCQNQLTPCSYYETEEGQYCCETCPDEDPPSRSEFYDDSLVLDAEQEVKEVQGCTRSLSDEEKCVRKSQNEVKNPDVTKQSSQIAHMRLNFMSSHLQSAEENLQEKQKDFQVSTESIDLSNECNDGKSSPDVSLLNEKTSKLHSMTTRTDNENKSNKFVNKHVEDSTDSIHNRCLTATSHKLDCKDEFKSQDTKEMLGVAGDETDVNQCLSLVQKRLKLFENLVVNDEKDCDKENSPGVSTLIEPDSLEENSTAFNEGSKSHDLTKLSKEESQDEIDILNAKGIDLSIPEDEDNYPDELNPFRSDDDDNNGDGSDIKDKDNKEESINVKKKSTNPFGSSSDEDEDENNKNLIPPKPAARINVGSKTTQADSPQKRLLKAPRINLNPFWSDDEEPESEEEDKEKISQQTPVPKPRKNRENESGSFNNKSSLNRDEIYASSSSLASSTSTSTHSSRYRKRKPAPPPPMSNESSSSVIASPDSTSKPYAHSSPMRRPKLRKNKPAPLPPTALNASLPLTETYEALENLSLSESSMNQSVYKMDDSHNESWEDIKISKNEANKSKQSMSALSHNRENHEYLFHDKSAQGKWKRKKAPAPAIPIPQRRKIKVLSMKDVKRELSEIEMQQQGLEKQGVRLEQLIRMKCESGDGQDDESNLSMDADELVLELFALVNEKNELFRRQAELMLLKRQQRLEEEHADIEYQIRCLMCQPEATKTDFDKQREEALIQRLVEVVERRSEIVECLEMDRRREVEEDKSINMHMELYTAKNKGGNKSDAEEQNTMQKNKKIKLKEKIKEKHFKKSHKKDADKDVDETEVKLKRQNKRKWF
ncbi:MICAL-like protein 1 isoform X2 [Chelonus insularis]|uniref:MICAL-like protein 1 isoform X2 n=1 Tax=Chelonus insularis TaxID=460826 RepID=UPI00158CA2AB|nr:MICAL-like protein 1 isoform X2 [Chelonus insularis]